jgi:hypothetical protein
MVGLGGPVRGVVLHDEGGAVTLLRRLAVQRVAWRGARPMRRIVVPICFGGHLLPVALRQRSA